MKAWDQWECNNCLESHPTIIGSPAIIPRSNESNEHSAPNTPPPVDPFLKPHELDRAPSKLGEDVPIDTSIPDITNWTTEEVFEYFSEHHPEAAPILRDQVNDLLL